MDKKSNIKQSILALEKVILKAKPDTSTHMKSTVAALYYAENQGTLKYANIIGLLQLDTDRKLKTKFLRIYNMDTLALAFEVQLYYGFADNYRQKGDTFYVFDYTMGTIGLLFQTKQDADIMLLKIKSQSPDKKQLKQILDERLQKQKKKQQENSFFGKLKKKVFGHEQQQIKEQSQVQQVKKLNSFSIDTTGNMQFNEGSLAMQEIFSQLQLSEEDLKNPEIMNMIASQAVVHKLKKQVKQNPKNQQLKNIVKEIQNQEKQYADDCRRSKMMKMPPPPPPPPILSPVNTRISMGIRGNLLDQIRNNNLKLKHVETNEKGGINIDMSYMDKQERNDFATQIQRKIALRKLALNKWQDEEND